MASFEGIELKTMTFTINLQNNDNTFNNLKVVKFTDRLQPYVMVKTSILDATDIPSWNTRQLILFNFEDGMNLTSSGTGKVITQYVSETITDVDFDFSDYALFKIIKIKAVGGSEEFKNIQQSINLFQLNASLPDFGDISGSQLEDINITKDSFDPKRFDTNYFQTVRYFMFGFKCITPKSLLYDTNELNNITHVFENMIYIYENNFTTGFSALAVETTMKFVFLMKNTDQITIVNTTPTSDYNILINNSSSNIIDIDTVDITTMFVKIDNGVTNSKINLRFISDDIIFNTFVPIFKEVNGTPYLLSSRPSGLNPSLYIFNVSVFKISAVDNITRSTTSVISLNGSREIELVMEPDLKQTYFGGVTPFPPLRIIITNQNQSIFDMPGQVLFPDISGSIINNPKFTITSTSNPDNLNNLLLVTFDIDTSTPIFQNISIPNISIQVASIVANTTKCFINTATSNISYNPRIVISTAPGTLDGLSGAALTGINQQAVVSPQTYNFNVKVIDNQYIIEYIEDLQVETIVRRFGSLVTDISFQAYEGDTYIFDTSHISNQNHVLSFFTNSTIIGNNQITSEDTVVYDININQGSSGSTVTLYVPSYQSFTNIYISDFPSGENQQNKLSGLCRLNILSNPTDISLGTFNFTRLIGDGTSVMSLIPALDSNNIPIQSINTLDIDLDTANTDATRVLELFSGEKAPIPQIIVNSIYLSKPTNVKFTVSNKNFITITWELNGGTIYPFANPRKGRFTIDVYYNIYREDADTNNIALIGTSLLNTFIDRDTINFNNYNYYIESVATWEGFTMTSERSEELFVFVCENNRFPDGRWNNSFSNPKLYKELSTCSNRNSITTNLYPNSWSLSKKQIYARLSKLPITKR